MVGPWFPWWSDFEIKLWNLKSNLGWLVLSDEERGQIPLCHEMKTIGANRTRSLGRTVTTLQRNI
jgi:hypothetical protein